MPGWLLSAPSAPGPADQECRSQGTPRDDPAGGRRVADAAVAATGEDPSRDADAHGLTGASFARAPTAANTFDGVHQRRVGHAAGAIELAHAELTLFAGHPFAATRGLCALAWPTVRTAVASRALGSVRAIGSWAFDDIRLRFRHEHDRGAGDQQGHQPVIGSLHASTHVTPPLSISAWDPTTFALLGPEGRHVVLVYLERLGSKIDPSSGIPRSFETNH